jgi:hypothetical protein
MSLSSHLKVRLAEVEHLLRRWDIEFQFHGCYILLEVYRGFDAMHVVEGLNQSRCRAKCRLCHRLRVAVVIGHGQLLSAIAT